MSACTINWPLVLEFFRIAASWPTVSLIGITFFGWVFRGEIRKLLTGKMKLQVPGGSFEAESLQQQPLRIAPTLEDAIAATSGKVEFAKQTDPATPVQVTDAEIPPDVLADTGAQEVLNAVKRNPNRTFLVLKQLWGDLQNSQTFSAIFGSQIAALEALEKVYPAPLKLPDLMPFYQSYMQRSGDQTKSLADYYGYLESRTLIQKAGAPDDYTYSLTTTGIEFMSYARAALKSTWPRPY